MLGESAAGTGRVDPQYRQRTMHRCSVSQQLGDLTRKWWTGLGRGQAPCDTPLELTQGWRVNMIHRGHYCLSCQVTSEPIDTLRLGLDQKQPVFFFYILGSDRQRDQRLLPGPNRRHGLRCPFPFNGCIMCQWSLEEQTAAAMQLSDREGSRTGGPVKLCLRDADLEPLTPGLGREPGFQIPPTLSTEVQ